MLQVHQIGQKDGGKCWVVDCRIDFLGICVGCVVVAVVGGCRLLAILWLAKDFRCSIVIFACVIAAVGMSTLGFVVFVVFACILFIVAILTVVTVMFVIVMVVGEEFAVGAVRGFAVGGYVFLVVVAVIADGFARLGCGFVIMSECREGTGCMKQLMQLVG